MTHFRMTPQTSHIERPKDGVVALEYMVLRWDHEEQAYCREADCATLGTARLSAVASYNRRLQSDPQDPRHMSVWAKVGSTEAGHLYEQVWDIDRYLQSPNHEKAETLREQARALRPMQEAEEHGSTPARRLLAAIQALNEAAAHYARRAEEDGGVNK